MLGSSVPHFAHGRKFYPRGPLLHGSGTPALRAESSWSPGIRYMWNHPSVWVRGAGASPVAMALVSKVQACGTRVWVSGSHCSDPCWGVGVMQQS